MLWQGFEQQAKEKQQVIDRQKAEIERLRAALKPFSVTTCGCGTCAWCYAKRVYTDQKQRKGQG